MNRDDKIPLISPQGRDYSYIVRAIFLYPETTGWWRHFLDAGKKQDMDKAQRFQVEILIHRCLLLSGSLRKWLPQPECGRSNSPAKVLSSHYFPISFSCFKSFYLPLGAISLLARFIYEIFLLFAGNGRRPSPSRVANRRGCKLSNTISRFTRREKKKIPTKIEK